MSDYSSPYLYALELDKYWFGHGTFLEGRLFLSL